MGDEDNAGDYCHKSGELVILNQRESMLNGLLQESEWRPTSTRTADVTNDEAVPLKCSVEDTA